MFVRAWVKVETGKFASVPFQHGLDMSSLVCSLTEVEQKCLIYVDLGF